VDVCSDLSVAAHFKHKQTFKISSSDMNSSCS